MRIPEKLRRRLNAADFGPRVGVFVNGAMTVVEDNKLPFFPHYTDHGRTHLERVLATMEDRLIPEDVWAAGLLTPEDAAVLVCATVLHDLGMHLSDEGFVRLISGQTPHGPLNWFDRPHGTVPGDRPWPAAWDRYMAEATRWSDRDLFNLFGPLPPGDSAYPLRRPPLDHRSWTQYDRLVIGEFIRRHHPRLAHEIAIHGFPGLSTEGEGSFPRLADGLPKLADLAGVVARSHGHPMRYCTDYLDDRYRGDLRPQGAAPVYLMALLRVADYLQIDSERAPRVLWHLRQPASPISLDEWDKHRAIEHISFTHLDPQAIKVQLNAAHSLRTHLQVEELLHGLQHELDESAAVVSEFYGRVIEGGMDRLRLSKARVRSNLYEESLLEQLPYYPGRFRFEAEQSLLRLMIIPLYGHQPAIGIRELVQNAVDAVRERTEYCRLKGIDPASLTFAEQEEDVLVELARDGEKWVLTVTDKGIGMEAETIQNYFLRAGATFRKSDRWQRAFLDPQGSRVLRSGRFGVGVFASFLLGPAIRLRTRHIDDTTGRALVMDATLDSEAIEILKTDQQAPFGTQIRIELDEATASSLKDNPNAWDWYTLGSPRVSRRVHTDRGPARIGQRFTAPEPAAMPDGGAWRKIDWAHDFAAILWTKTYYPPVTCNGLRIAQCKEENKKTILSDATYEISDGTYSSALQIPCVSVFDADGKLPLTLNRERLDATYLPFEAELIEDVAADFVAFCLVHAPRQHLWSLSPEFWHYFRGYPLSKAPAFGVDGASRSAWFCTGRGTAPVASGVLESLPISRLFVSGEVGGSSTYQMPTHIPPDGVAYHVHLLSKPLLESVLTARPPFDRLERRAVRVTFATSSDDLLLGSRTWLGRLLSMLGGKGEKDLQFARRVRRTRNSEIFVVSLRAKMSPSFDAVKDLAEYDWPRAESNLPFVIESLVDADRATSPTGFLERAWDRYIGRRLIPFDPDERARLVDEVIKEHPRIEAHLKRYEERRRNERPG
jgi:hypothetical protein